MLSIPKCNKMNESIQSQFYDNASSPNKLCKLYTNYKMRRIKFFDDLMLKLG